MFFTSSAYFAALHFFKSLKLHIVLRLSVVPTAQQAKMMMNKGLVHKQKKHLPGPNPVYEKEYRPSKTISKKDKDNEKNAPSRKKHLAGPASVFQEDIVQNKKLFHEKYTSPYARGILFSLVSSASLLFVSSFR